MGKHRRWIQVVILSAAVILGTITIGSNLFSNNELKVPQVGDKPPGFSLYGLDGRQHSLSEFKGKVMMINFWGTFCPPCAEEMPAIQEQYALWKEKGVAVLGVNLDEETITVQSFIKQNKVTFPILFDEKLRITRKYGVNSYPTTFFINRQGRIEEIAVGGMTESFIEQKLSSMTR